MEQKDAEVTALLSRFPQVALPASPQEPLTIGGDRGLRLLRHKRRRFDSWPPEKTEV